MLSTIAHRLRPIALVLGYLQLVMVGLYPITFLPTTVQRLAAVGLIGYGIYRLRGRLTNRRAGAVPSPAPARTPEEVTA